MKKSKLILLLFTVLLMVNACDNKDLELTNPEQLSPETFFKTDAQVNAALLASYGNVQTQGLYTRHMFFSMDLMGRDAGWNPHMETDKAEYYFWTFGSTHGGIGDYYESCMKGINKANFVLGNEDKITSLENSVISATNKAKYIAEAKFLRAFYSFLAVTRFGKFPLIVGIPEDGTGPSMTSKADIYAQIEKDLTEAIPGLLPKSEEINGRATSGAARALLGKVLLFQNKYGPALTQFEAITGYSLEPNYFDNFMEETEGGVESIYEIAYDDALPGNNNWGSGTNGNGGNESTFRDQEYNFKSWHNAYPHEDLVDAFEPGDLRKSGTIYEVGDLYNNGNDAVELASLFVDNLQRVHAWKKYQTFYKSLETDTESGINFKYLRWADVLLMMAECENEVGTQAAAIGYINQVRDRADLDDLPLTLTKAQVFDAIVQERRVEFGGEQIRFNDIIRWGIADETLENTLVVAPSNLNATDAADYIAQQEAAHAAFNPAKNDLWPIPEREINSNENVGPEDQNPGY